jgi:hypothetical protein
VGDAVDFVKRIGKIGDPRFKDSHQSFAIRD